MSDPTTCRVCFGSGTITGPDSEVPCFDCASPQPDTAPEEPPIAVASFIGPLVDLLDPAGWPDPESTERYAVFRWDEIQPVLAAALNGAHATPEDDDERLCEECGELASLHPSDTPPVLNGASATPAERAVIDAAVAETEHEQAHGEFSPRLRNARVLAVARLWNADHPADDPARLRSERNKNDG